MGKLHPCRGRNQSCVSSNPSEGVFGFLLLPGEPHRLGGLPSGSPKRSLRVLRRLNTREVGGGGVRGSYTQDRSEPPNKDYSVQRLLLGTHTSEGEQNYLMRAQVQLPLEDTETDARQYDEVGVVSEWVVSSRPAFRGCFR